MIKIKFIFKGGWGWDLGWRENYKVAKHVNFKDNILYRKGFLSKSLYTDFK